MDGRVAVVAVPGVAHVAGRLHAGLLRIARIAVAVAVRIGVPEGAISQTGVRAVDQAVTVVVEAVADLLSTGIDGRISIVTIDVVEKSVAVEVDDLDRSVAIAVRSVAGSVRRAGVDRIVRIVAIRGVGHIARRGRTVLYAVAGVAEAVAVHIGIKGLKSAAAAGRRHHQVEGKLRWRSRKAGRARCGIGGGRNGVRSGWQIFAVVVPAAVAEERVGRHAFGLLTGDRTGDGQDHASHRFLGLEGNVQGSGR